MLQHEPEGNRPLRNSCDLCIQSKTKCNKEKPSCRRCVRQDKSCVYSVSRRPGRPRKTAQISNGSQGVDDRSRKPAQQGSLHWEMWTSTCSCQQHSSSLSGLDDGVTDFVITDAAITAQNEDAITSPRLDFGLHTGSTFEPGLLRSNISSIDSVSNYPLDFFQGETEESVAGYYALVSDGRTRQGSLHSMATYPDSIQINSEYKRSAQHPTDRSDGTILSSFSDIETAFSEGSTSLELDNTIRFIADSGKSNLGTAVNPVNHFQNSGVCFCSTAIRKLLILVSHPALWGESRQLPLDIVLFFEDYIYKIHESVSSCSTCRTMSLHSRALLCVSTDWIMEILRNIVQNISSNQEAQKASSIEFAGAEDSSMVRVGRLVLDSHLQRLCTRTLIKHRLRRLVLTIDKIYKQDKEWRGAALQQTARIVMQEIHHKIESILGMMEL